MLKGGRLYDYDSFHSPSGTEAMRAFIKKTGAIRFHNARSSFNLDFDFKPSSEQKMTIAKFADRDTEVFVDANKQSGEFRNFTDFIRSKLQVGAKEYKPTKIGKKLQEKATKELGLTDDIREAGYIMRDGSMIDLSGKRQGGSYGTRELDHREVAGFTKVDPKTIKKRDLKYLIGSAQRSRKNSAHSKHEFANLKNDYEKLKKSGDLELVKIYRELYAKQLKKRKGR
jgi:hypothetical protein